MMRFAMPGLMAVSMLFAACATQDPAPNSTSDDTTAQDTQDIVGGTICTAAATYLASARIASARMVNA